jgi:cell filamentation protein
MPGLDGTNDLQDTAAQYEDPAVTKGYQAFERRRGYKLDK